LGYDRAMESNIELTIDARARDLGGFAVRRALPSMRLRHVGPFVFFDHMGPMELAPGQGMDVRPHPHVALATITYLFDGAIMHKDSLGSAQLIEPGDVNWMLAGRGIAHSERTPPDVRARGGKVHGIQSWVALPEEHEDATPRFDHHDASTLPTLRRGGATLRVVAGSAYGETAPTRVLSPTLYVHARLDAGAELAVDETHVTSALGGLDADLQQVEQQGVQLIAMCALDVATVTRISGAVRKAGLGQVHLYAREAYDQRALARNSAALDGVIAGVPFVPWEAASASKGTHDFLAAMKHRGVRPTLQAQAGWIGAQLLVDGIEKAGKHFTQQSVIDAINAMTSFTADGMLPGIDWSNGGHGPGREACTAFVEATKGRFVPRFAAPTQPFVCFADNPLPATLDAPTFKG
jgi:redox-sensitive bicupin YhaK (pirin superfamily)